MNIRIKAHWNLVYLVLVEIIHIALFLRQVYTQTYIYINKLGSIHWDMLLDINVFVDITLTCVGFTAATAACKYTCVVIYRYTDLTDFLLDTLITPQPGTLSTK